MTVDAVTREELEGTRATLVESIHKAFTDDDRELLLSIKRGSPRWELLNIEGVEILPAVRWKLQNLEKLQERKRAQLVEQLSKVLMRKAN